MRIGLRNDAWRTENAWRSASDIRNRFDSHRISVCSVLQRRERTICVLFAASTARFATASTESKAAASLRPGTQPAGNRPGRAPPSARCGPQSVGRLCQFRSYAAAVPGTPLLSWPYTRPGWGWAS